MNEADLVWTALSNSRIDLSVEMVSQDQIARALKNWRIGFKKEVRLGPGCRVDFLCRDGTAIEVKLAGSSKNIYRQIMRYCLSEDVSGVIIASARSMHFPSEVNGKPCRVLSLGRAWM